MTTVGILGAGQLGRMLALAGYPLGLRFRFFATAADEPAADLGPCDVGAYDCAADLQRFAATADVVTYEFENVPAAAAACIARRTTVFPPPAALAVAQDRMREKRFLQGLRLPTAPFATADTAAELTSALAAVGLPAVLKRRRLGYDGGGQLHLRCGADAAAAWHQLGGEPLVVEGLVRFRRELSIIAVRSRAGQVAAYPLIETRHVDGILRSALAPAPDVTPDVEAAATDYATRILLALGYVGALTVELFETENGLVVNELAPRVHNSGHWTIEGAHTSQFENHLRAILGWPLGSTEPLGCSALVNLIGVAPPAAPILALRDTHLHLYGKLPRARRKLGHITIRAPRPTLLHDRLRTVEHLVADATTRPQ